MASFEITAPPLQEVREAGPSLAAAAAGRAGGGQAGRADA